MGTTGKARATSRAAAILIAAALAITAVGVLALASAPQPAAAAVTPAGDRCLVRATVRVFLGREASPSEVSTWTSRFASGWNRSRLSNELANSDEWLGVEVSKLYRGALDREPDADGRRYWIGELRRGARVNDVGSLIYGSGEFYSRAGSTPTGFVNSIYTRILGRAPDADGRAYWVDQVGRLGRGAVAASFFASLESRTSRVTALYRQVLGRAPSAGDASYWAGQLNRVNDVRLAVQLASAAEFYDRHDGCEASGPIAYGQTVYGSIATAGQQNTYTFAGRSGDKLSLDALSSHCCSLVFRLVAPNGAVIWNNVDYADRWIALTQNGTHRLTVSNGTSRNTGAYSFHISDQRNAQTFNVGYGTTIGNNTPSAGMGNLDRPGASDTYRFNATNGDKLSFDLISSHCCSLVLRLVAPNGAVIWNNVDYADRWIALTQNGTYQLTVSNAASANVGSYGFHLSNQRNPQAFTISFGTTVSNGVPQAGMGNIDRPGATDLYRFSASNGTRMTFDSLGSHCCSLVVRLVAPNGSVVWNNVGYGDRTVTLGGGTGTYQLIVGNDTSANVGSYSFSLVRS